MKIRIVIYGLVVAFMTVGCTGSQNDKGRLIVKENSTLIHKADGKAFLWLGDTAWELFSRLTREETIQYLDNRQDKGFTVIQAVAVFGGLDRPNVYGEAPFLNNDIAQPNEKFFEHVDFVMDETEKRGMYMGFLPAWGHHVVKNSDGKSNLTVENARRYGRFLGERYKDKSVIWILGGDRNIFTDEEYAIWNEMAAGIKEGDNGRNLMTYHPTGVVSSHYWFHNSPWLSFNMMQSGHFKKLEKLYLYAGTYAQLSPIKPYVNGEPAYEDIAVSFFEFGDFAKFGKTRDEVIKEGLIVDPGFYQKGFFDDADIRNEAYWTFFSGGAGYTYGNNAVFQFYTAKTKGGIPALTYWQEALDRSGADDIRHIDKLFTAYPLESFHIDYSAIFGLNFNEDAFIPALVGNDYSFVMAYMNFGQPVRIEMSKLNGQATGYWFDPREGTVAEIGKFDPEGIASFNPPGKQGRGNDWILILDTKEEYRF